MAKPSEQQAGISVDRGRWQLEWDSEKGEDYILHDSTNEHEQRLTFDELRDLRFVLSMVGEMRSRDLKLRQQANNQGDD